MALENFTGELDAPESGGYEVFTGELDSPAEVSQGRSASMADPRRLDNPANQPEQSFLSRVGDSITGLAKTAAATNPVIGRFLNISGGPREDTSQRSVLDDQPNVVGGVSPNDMAENERLSRRAYAEEVEQRQRIANSPSMRATVDATGAQAYADQNPVSAGLKSGTAKFLGGVLNAPSVAAGLATETVNRVATDAGGQPVFDRVGNMPLVEDLRKVSQDYASQLSRKSPGQAWDDGDFGRWMMSQMAENSPSAALSLAALFLPGAQAAVLGSMGASAAGSSYAEGDSAAAATLKGLVEVGSEKLPLSAAEKLKDIVLAIPAGSRNLVLAEAGKRLAAAGTAITANSLVGAIEESAAQIGGNAIDILIDKKTKNLFEDVDRAAIVGGAFGGAMSAPTLGALVSPESNRAREVANAMNAGTLPAAGVTVDEALRTSGATLIPEATSISAAQAAAARQLEARALSERATTAVEEIQAKAVADIGKATSVDEAIASAQNAVSLDGPGMVDEALKAAGVNTADLNAVATQASADTAAAVRQQAAAEIAQEAAAQKAASSPVTEAPATSQTEESTQPVKIWVGRRGDGYATPEDASRGLKERERLSPDLDWTTEQMPDGRYRLAGYARTVAQPVAAPVSADPLANEILQAEQKLDAQMQRRPSGTLAITGASAPAIRTQLQKAGIPSVPINGGIEVGRANAARAETLISQSSVVPTSDNEKYAAAAKSFNAMVPAMRAAREAGNMAEVQRLVEQMRPFDQEMKRIQSSRQSDAMSSVDRRIQSAAEAKYGELPIGARERPSEFPNGNVYWEKTGADEWTRFGLGSSNPKRANSEMGGTKAMDSGSAIGKTSFRKQVLDAINRENSDSTELSDEGQKLLGRLPEDQVNAARKYASIQEGLRQAREVLDDAELQEMEESGAAELKALAPKISALYDSIDALQSQEAPRVPESAAQAPGPSPAAAGTTAPTVIARAAQPAVAAGVPAARGSANQAPAVDLTTAKPDRLLYLSRNPTSPLQEAAVKELRRREVDAAYRQREASRPAEEQAIVEEARDQQAAQETARSVAQESDAPSAMQVAMERARAKREGREQGIKFSIDGSQAQVQNQANEPSRSTPETGKRTVASRSPGTSEQQRIADDIAQRVSARLGRTLVLDVVAPGRGESSARNKEESATVLTAKRLFGQDVIFVRQSERVFHGLMSDAYPNTVFIDIDTDKPMMAVLGHELLHQLRKNQPGIYRQLDERLTALLKNPGEFLDRIEAQYRAKGMEVPQNWDEELFADVVGDNFTDPEFWTAMAESQPRLFQRVANAIRQFLNNVLLKAKPFGTDQFMSDVRAARDAVVDAMRQFSGAEVGAMTDQMDGIALSVADSTPAKQSSTPAIQEEAMTAPSEKWELPAATKTDRLIFELQDGRIDLKRIQEAITAAKREIGEGFNARLAETLFPGRVARQTENFLEVEAKPLLEFMAKNKVTQDELSDYLLARHAPERNAQIARVNDELQDGGAGTNSQGVLMTTQAANDYMAALPANKRTMLDMAAKRVDAITKGTRDLLVSSGLESQATVDAWTSVYENYVPLFKDEALETPAHPMGSGMSVTGKTTKRATGSTGEVTNMLAHVLMQREAAITRAEKNKVAMSLYGLALTNPNSDVWTTIRPSMPEDMITSELERMGVDPAIAAASMQGVPTIRGVDPQSGKVIDRPNPMYKRLDNAIVVKVNGEDRVILFNENNPRAMRLAQNLKNQDRLIAFDLAGSIVGKATRYFASINTQYNPAFGMVNIVRDVGGALVNLTDTKLAGQQAKVLGNSVPAMIGIARDLRGDPQRTPWSDLWQQFQEDGGRTGYRDLFADPYKRAEAVQSELDKLSKAGKLTPGAMAHAALDFLDDFNTTLENGIRLSAYKAALDDGMTGPQAARLARELTLDFNRKGRTGRELGPLYAFFNASVQGTARTVQAIKGPAGAKIITGGLALGVIQALMLAAAGYEDDEIPEFIKARAFIIPLAGKQYIAIPLQFGLNALPNTGRVLTELAMSRGKDWAEKSFAAIGELAGSFNPLGGGNIFTAHGALTTVAPTIADPFIDLAQNRNFAGTPIAKETFPGDQRPGFTLGREGTQRTLPGQMYIGISKAINTAMGGNDFKKGIYSPKPEEVKYVFTTVGGGVYRELEKAFNAAEGMVSGRELKAREIPLGSRFGGEVEDADVQRTRYFKNSKKINALEAEYKGFAKAGRSEEASALMKNEPLAKLYSMNDTIARDIAQLNKLAATKIGDRKALEELDARRAKLYKILNDQVIKLEKAAEKAKRE